MDSLLSNFADPHSSPSLPIPVEVSICEVQSSAEAMAPPTASSSRTPISVGRGHGRVGAVGLQGTGPSISPTTG